MCLISSICDSFSDSHFDNLLSSSLYSCQLFNTSCNMLHLRFKITKRTIFVPYQKQALITNYLSGSFGASHNLSFLKLGMNNCVLPQKKGRLHVFKLPEPAIYWVSTKELSRTRSKVPSSYLCSVHLHTFDQRSPRTASCSSRSAVALSLLLSSTTTTM